VTSASIIDFFKSKEPTPAEPIRDIEPAEFKLDGIAGPETNRYAVINGEVYSTGARLRAYAST